VSRIELVELCSTVFDEAHASSCSEISDFRVFDPA